MARHRRAGGQSRAQQAPGRDTEATGAMMLKFLEMGGYAAYVWPSYALALIVVVINIVAARRALRTAQREATARLARARVREQS